MPPADDRPTRWIGRIIDGRYRIVELLGEGGMGAVYVAEHLKLHKHVAIKTIRSEFAANSQAEARFTREALATARLDHPHVASAIDYGHLPEGGAYLVIQLVRGHSLTKRIEQGALSWLDTCRLGSQIADALAAAHALGIVHRDLKPDNILLEPRDDGSFHARVLDFGIARVAASETSTGTLAGIGKPITRMGAVVGTPGYMAPEQAVGQQVDLRVDLYALGVILWEACTGQVLWDGETLTDLFAAQLSRPAPSLRNIRSNIPAPLSALVDHLLARKPEERPAGAAAVRDELRRLALNAEVNLVLAASSEPRPAAASPSLAKPATSANPGPGPARSTPPVSAKPGPGPARSTPPVSAKPGPGPAPPVSAKPGPGPARSTPPVGASANAARFTPPGTAVSSTPLPASAASSSTSAASSSASAASSSSSTNAASGAAPRAAKLAAPASASGPAVSASATPGPATLVDAPRTIASRERRAATQPEPRGSATAIPRAVWLSGLVVLVLLVVVAVVATRMAGPKDSSRLAPADREPADASAPGTPRPADRSPIEALIAEIPAAYAGHARVLLTSDDARARERAGEAIALAPAEDKPAIPEYIRNLAWFEQVTDCEDKRPILDKIREADDPRALAGLQRIAATPPGDCRAGFMRFECIECLRDELARVVARFEAERD